MSATRPSPLRNLTDARDGMLCNIAHATLAGVQRASSALLAGLEQSVCVARAASGSETNFGQSDRDPKNDAAGFKRKSIAAVSASVGAAGAVSTKRTETKQATKVERAKTGKRSVYKSKLVVDEEDIDRDADCSDDE